MTRINKRIVLAVIFCAVTLGIMILIFSFSAQQAAISQKTGEGFTYRLFSIFPSFRKLAYPKKTEIVEASQAVIRKLAHFSIYAALGMSSFLSLRIIFGKRKLLWLVAEIFSAAYAMTDEFHQLFVSGRSGEWRDVLIDSLGAATGICIAFLITLLIAALFLKRKSKE